MTKRSSQECRESSASTDKSQGHLNKREDFPGDRVDKNLPDNAGDMGCIPDPGRSHQPRQLSPCTTLLSLLLLTPSALRLLKPTCLGPVPCNPRSHSSKKPMHCN